MNINVSQITGSDSPFVEPHLDNVQVWGTYAIVTDNERKKVGCKTRDIMIEQNKQLGGNHGSGLLNIDTLKATTTVDLRIDGSIKALFFGARNSSGSSNLPFRSNYTTSLPSASDITVCKIMASGTADIGGWTNGYTLSNSSNVSNVAPIDIHINSFNQNFNDPSGLVWNTDPTDPFGSIKILYDNNTRMSMESLYYSLIQPHNHARNVPESSSMKGIMSIRNPNEVGGQPALCVGYHMYSYALGLKCIDPCGVTNYNRVQNPSIVFTPSSSAINNYANGQGPWRIFISALTQNILRISNGAMEFPII